MTKIPITKPYFGPEEMEKILEPLKSGWVVQGPFVKEFEGKFSSFTGAGNSIATSSGTSALQIAVSALGLGPGDEVIVPAFTWVATANVVEQLGAKAVFCDVEIGTFNINPEAIEEKITAKTVGIIPVHLFGLSASMDAIIEIAQKHGLWVIEDAACGLGSFYRDQHCGTFGDIGCFSFHPRKSITTGEGGMITTASEKLNKESLSLRNHGAAQDGDQNRETFLLGDFDHLGFNYRMTDIQGALGSAQMERLDWILKQRRRLAERYDELLGNIAWLTLPETPSESLHAYQAYVTLFRPSEISFNSVEALHAQRNAVMSKLEKAGIASRPGTHSVANQTWYKKKYGFRPEDFPNSYIADRLSLAIPLYPQMTDQEQELVVETLRTAI